MDTAAVCACVCVHVLHQKRESEKAQLVSRSMLWNMSIETA